MKQVLLGICCVLALAGCDRFASADTRVKRAEAAIAEGDQRTAVVELMNALRKEPGLAHARLLFAESVLWLGDANGAQRELDLIKGDIDAARRAELEVRIALASGRVPQALEKLNDPATPIPADRRELYLGTAHMQAQDFAQAEKHFTAAYAANAGMILARTGALEARAARGERAQVLEELQGLTRGHPDSAAVWASYGIQLAANGDAHNAEAALSRAVELSPRQLEVSRQAMLLSALVEMQLLQGELPAARESAANLERVVPRSPVSRYVAARISMADNDYAKAVTDLREVTGSSPNLVQARLLLALALVAQGNLGQASQELHQLLEIAPQHPGARQLLAQVRMRLDDPDGALRMLVPVLESGGDAQVNALIDAARSQLGAAQSVRLLEEMLAKDPDNEGARAQLASAYLQGKQPEKAAKLLREGGGNDVSRAALLLKAISESEGDSAARAKVDSLVAANPANPYIATLAASYYTQAGDLAAGRAVLNRALERGAPPASVLLPRAQLEWTSGARAEASATLAKLLALDPDNLLAHTAAGEIALAQGDAKNARLHFDAVLRQRPESLDARVRLAQLALSQGDTAQADKLAAAAIKLAPRSAELRNALGLLYLNSGRADQALAQFRAATEVQADNPASWLNMARTQRVLGQAGAARESATKALSIRADWLPAVAVLAVMDLEAHNPDAAFARVAAAKKAMPPNTAVLVLEGDIFAAGQRDADASTAYQAAYAREPNGQVAVKDYRVRVAGKLPKADQLLERWSAANPGDLNARVLLADAAIRNGERARAAEQYRKVLDAQPDNVVVLNNLAWLYFEGGDKRGLDLAREAVRLAPKLAAANDTLGWLLLNDGKAAEALPYFETALTQASADPDIRYHHAVALTRTGAVSEGQRRLEALLRESGQFEGRVEAEKLLKSLPAGS